MKLIQILKKNAIPSFCSSNSQVIEILFKFCKFHKVPLLVESTSNQVNQYGGYSNNTPKEFIKKIKKIAEKEKFNKKKLFFGGDHLGPLPWKLHKSREALRRSIRLIRSFNHLILRLYRLRFSSTPMNTWMPTITQKALYAKV
jgi:D-tagatose-1,6-bisphosphate aldolase subunit GatZ/KbaZ